MALNEKVRFAFALRLSHAQQSSFDLCVSVKLRCVTVYGYEGKWIRCVAQAVEQQWEREGDLQLPDEASVAVLMSGGIGAVKVWILAAHEAALLVV